MKINPKSISSAGAAVRAALTDTETLEAACQAYARTLHERFRESIVLARTFAVLPMKIQPPGNAEFARGVADSLDASLVSDQTPVLTLLGTHGDEPAWCDRQCSENHLAIPLLSSGNVSGIPMLARLLYQLGLGLDWIDRPSAMNISIVGKLSGLFYVEDASTALDKEGRHIIPAQDFVSRHGVGSVFGNAMMLDLRTFMITIVFARGKVDQRAASALLELGADVGVQGAQNYLSGHLFV